MKRAAAHLDAGAGCRLSLAESERTAGIWELGTAFQWQIVGRLLSDRARRLPAHKHTNLTSLRAFDTRRSFRKLTQV